MYKNLTITETLMSLNDGGAMEELATELKSCVNAVTVTGKKGKVQLTMEVLPNGQSAVMVTDKIVTTLPKADPVATSFFVTDDAGLSRRDPRQPELKMETR